MRQIIALTQSDSDENVWYEITRLDNGRLACRCPAFSIQKNTGQNGLDCKHLTRARAELDKGQTKFPVRIPSPYWTRRSPQDIWRKGPDVKPAIIEKLQIGQSVIDDVLGGGLAKGCTTLLAGGPGCGKSILCGFIASLIAAAGKTVLYAVGEEPPENYLARLKHYGITFGERVMVGSTAYIGDIESGVEKFRPELTVTDSLQAHTYQPGQFSTPLVQQNILQRLIKLSRVRRAAMLVIGHYTKGGDVKGGLTVQHDADAVIKIEKDLDFPQERVVRVEKNRSGPNGVTFRYILTKTEMIVSEDKSAGMGAALLQAKRDLAMDLQDAAA